MITTSEEYQSMLHRIQDENFPSLAILLPSDENIYEIDLNSRTIFGPENLSVETDHIAETIYFKVDRFFDNMDLTNLCCIIQYVNAAGEGGVYAVPYYDIETLSNKEKDIILFPWVIDRTVTKQKGIVNYSIRFFSVSTSGKYLNYNLNTLATTGTILEVKYIGDIENTPEFQDNHIKLASIEEKIYSQIKAIGDKDLYWMVL